MGFAVIFKASVRQRGSATVRVAPAQEMGELEVDGVWYKWMEPVDAKSSVLSPGSELDNIAVVPDNKWRSAAADLRQAPANTRFVSRSSRDRSIRPAGRRFGPSAIPSKSSIWRRCDKSPARIVGVWFSGHVVNDATGELMTNFLLQPGCLIPAGPGGDLVRWPNAEPNFIGGQWSRNPELGGFWGAQDLADTNQKAWARIVAGGYVTQTVSPEPVTGSADIHDLTVRMKRGGEMTGVVLDHAGQPATGAKVILVNVQKLRVRDGVTGWWFGRLGDQFQSGVDTANASGRFTLSGNLKAAQAVVAVSADARMVWAVANNGATNGVKIQLPEPATIKVRYDIPGDAPGTAPF